MTRLLSRVSVALLLTLLVASAAMAQEKDDENHPITSKGSAAMLFQFGGLSSMQFAAVDLGALSYPGEESGARSVLAAGAKYYISDDLALRALLGFSTNTSGADSIGNGKTTETIFGIGVGAEMHTHAYHAISPYFGGQLTYAMASSDNTKSSVDAIGGKNNPLATTTTTETKKSASGFGIEVLVGFDWYVMSSIALGGEYSLGFSTASASQTVNGTTADAPSVTNIAIGTADVHLVVHF